MMVLQRMLLYLCIAALLLGCFVTGGEQKSSDAAPVDCRCNAPKIERLAPRRFSPSLGGTINIRIPREPATLLPHIENDPAVRRLVLGTVLERLVRKVAGSDTAQPELADRYEIEEDEGRYIFHIRENATWHDGHPVTAQDVRYVFSKLTDPYAGTARNSIFSNIKAIETPTDDTVVFVLDQFLPRFMDAVSTVPIIPSHVFGRIPLALHPAARAPIGSGPFRFVRWVPSRLIELERNPAWWGIEDGSESGPYVEILRFHIVPDNRIAVDMMNHRDLDIVPDLPASSAFPVREGSRLVYPLPHFETLVYNFNNPIFAERSARQALAMLIDKDAIRCSLLRCLADLPGESAAESIQPTLPYDPVAAKKSLHEVGWRDRDGDGIIERDGRPFVFSLLVPNFGRDLERVAIAVQADLAKVGIDMRLSTVSHGAFFGRLASARFDVALLTVPIGAAFDPWSLFHTPKGATGNFGGFSSRRVDAYLDRMMFEPAPSVRSRLATELNEMLVHQQPMTFTFRTYGAAYVRDHVGGVTFEDGWIAAVKLYIEERP